MSGSDEVRNEELKRLLDDEDWQETSELGHSLQEMIDNFLQKVRPNTLKELKGLMEAVEKSYDDSRKARIAGTTATIVGSTIAITGFGLSFFTLGASLGLTVAGAALAAAGGATIGGAEIGYLTVSRKKLKKSEQACCADNEAIDEIKACYEKYSDQLDSLVEKHPTFTKENIFRLVKQAWTFTGPTLKTFYSGYKVVDGATDVGRNAIAVTNTIRAVRAGSVVKAGAQVGARGVYFGLGTFGRVFSIASVAFDVVFIPIDIAVLAKSAYDVHKYKNGADGGTSNSKAASNIRNILTQLEESEKKLIKIRNHLPGDEIDQ